MAPAASTRRWRSPDDIGIFTIRANALLSSGRAEEALAAFREILARVPHSGGAAQQRHRACGLGALTKRSRLDHALTLAPGHPPRISTAASRSTISAATPTRSRPTTARSRRHPIIPRVSRSRPRAGRLNRFDDAIASYGKAHALRKDDADVTSMESLALLTLGDYRRGFERYDGAAQERHARAEEPRPAALARRLSAARKTVLSDAEQGPGDTISSRAMCRCSPRTAPGWCSK